MGYTIVSPAIKINKDDIAALKGLNLDGLTVFPGFADVHVHLREPGFFYKETIKSGTMAAARGGYTHVLSMPNLNPTPDSVENLRIQLDVIDRDAVVNVTPFGTITVGEKGEVLADMAGMTEYVCGYSDDGHGVQSREMMVKAMKEVHRLDKIISAHCEDNCLLHGGCIHDGEFAAENGFAGICSESEWGPIKRDVELAKETGCKYHVCHVSTKESVEIIRQAKANGIDITCETGPHYLTLCDMDMQDEGRFKMNPPLRSAQDRDALIQGIIDGTVDMIATDHAPHSVEEKSRGLKDSLMGVVGLETAFPVLYTELVRNNIISIDELVMLLAVNPRKRFGLPLSEGLSVWDLNCEYVIDPEEFETKGSSTPFEGKRVFGRCVMTVLNGKIVWKDKKYIETNNAKEGSYDR